ncbi:MAG: hypothetical protein ACXWPM_00730 [Bdellovibrionota bacterium]
MSANTSVTVLDPGGERGMVDVQASRAVAEVQGAMAIAKKFPRDDKAAFTKIMVACGRKSLAESAIYEYPRGGEKVSGPSIRLAEAIAQSWGNLATGVIELDRREGKSLAMAYCVDLETNYRKDVTFEVPHIRDTKQGGKSLTETRDIYELVMNMGSRRLRNCIMAVIPGDIFDAAVGKCAETLMTDKVPLQDRIREMLAAFADFAVTAEMISTKYGCKIEALSPQQLAKLRSIFQSLKDGVGDVKDFFDVAPTEASRTDKLNQEANKTGPRAKETAPAAKPAEAPASAPDADPNSFENFSGNLFAQKPPAQAEETMESLQVEVFSLVKELKVSEAQFNGRVTGMFKKSAGELRLDEVKKLRDFYQTELNKNSVK